MIKRSLHYQSVLALAMVLTVGPAATLRAQTASIPGQPTSPTTQPPLAPTTPERTATVDTTAKPEKAITPAQARELFRSVDQILQFASQETALPIRHPVKRRLTTRKAVEAFLVEKMHEDKDTARVERSEIVLKKFGMLPQEFALRPFMLSLLKEQIAGFYDAKTKTVNLLNWIDPEQQKPVLAHELTHALQDQHVDLEKWGDQSIDGTPRDVAEDNRHLRQDEADTAREAALEGQAMVTYMDWSLAPMAQSLRTSPDIPADQEDTEEKPDPDNPVLSRAPFVLKESLLFPYQDGLRFEQTLLKDHGAAAAFAAVLDRPPETSYEIMHPHAYEQRVKPALLTLPDLHPLLDATYTPYDLGVMGALDVRMLGQLFGGAGPAADLALGWDGGEYYAAQRKAAPDKNSTASVGLLYLSRWTTPAAADSFAKLYATSLTRKYKQLRAEPPSQDSRALHFATEEGPVVIATDGMRVFVSEGFESDLAIKLQRLMMPASGAVEAAQPAALQRDVPGRAGAELTAPLVGFFAAQGMMKSGLRASHPPR